MTRALITGITGFVGSNLAQGLLAAGFDVHGVVRHCSTRELGVLRDIQDRILLLTSDITNYHSTVSAFRISDPDIVIHLAALTPVRHSFEHPFTYEQANFVGTMNVLHAFMELPDYKHRKIIAASTAEVYGLQRRNEPFSEECELRPSSPYAVSKAAAEMYLKMSAKVYGLNCTVLRPCNSYGRLNETGFVVEYLIYSMLRGSKVYVGAPNSIRDYIHIDDHTRAYLRIIQQETEPGAVYNVGSGQGISNRDLSFKIASKIGYDRSDIVLGAYPPEYPQRPITSDQPYLVLDASKIKSLGWTQEVSLDQGLDRSVAHWRPRVPDLR